jgi:hypothetical protein
VTLAGADGFALEAVAASSSRGPFDAIAAFNTKAILRGWQARFERAHAFKAPALNDLLRIWLERAAHGIPSRTDFDARSLKPILPYLSVVECVTTDGVARYRVRLVGTAMARIFGEQTGKFIDEALPRAVLERWVAVYDTVLAAGGPVRIESVFQLPQFSYLACETFSAPVRGVSGNADTILSASQLDARTDVPRN